MRCAAPAWAQQPLPLRWRCRHRTLLTPLPPAAAAAAAAVASPLPSQPRSRAGGQAHHRLLHSNQAQKRSGLVCQAARQRQDRQAGYSKPPSLASLDEDAAAASDVHVSSSSDPAPDLLERDPFKEDSRKYLRTVFDFDRWAAHRSTRRYARHVLGMPKSRMVRGLAAPLLYSLALSTSIATYHTLAEAGLLPDIAAAVELSTSEPVNLTSFALSLLLVFRTNASYSRWLDARKHWELIVDRSRDIVRQGITYIPREEQALLQLLCRWTVAYSRSVMSHLRCDVDAAAELERVLRPEEARSALAAAHRPNYCLQVISEVIRTAAKGENRDMKALADVNITALQDVMGSCERILKTPIPLSYTRHTSRFMMIWLTLLPFSLWDDCHWMMVPLTAVISFLLLGIEEIGVAIEEPFSILPLEQLCDVLERNVWELYEMHTAPTGSDSGGSSSSSGEQWRPLTASDVVLAAQQQQQ